MEDTPVEGIRESWWLAALTILSRANDLTEGFDEVQKWKRPYAHSDAGAALAFADISVVATSFESGTVGSRVLIAIFEALGEVFQAHPDALELHEKVARAFFMKGVTLSDLGRSTEAIAAYDELVARFGAAGEPPLRTLVASALADKGVKLDDLGRGEEAIAVYKEVVARFLAARGELPLVKLIKEVHSRRNLLRNLLPRSARSSSLHLNRKKRLRRILLIVFAAYVRPNNRILRNVLEKPQPHADRRQSAALFAYSPGVHC